MIAEALAAPFFQRALAAGLLAALACGIVGSFVVVRGIASISGGLAHAAFGGVGLGYLIGIDPILGALAFGLLSALIIGLAERWLDQGLDTLIATMWAVGMAMGIIFVSLAPGPAPDLMGFLFGNILFVPPDFVWFMVGLNVVIGVAVAFLYRRLEAVAFDEEFAWVIGVPVAALSLLTLGLVALTVVILIRVVGVILAIALLTMPAATARHWTQTLLPMMGLATLIGALCTTAGLFLTWVLPADAGGDVPTGPAIILITAVLYGASALIRRSLQARSA